MGESLHITNYSNGWVVEVVKDGDERCSSWMLLPAENLWGEGVRAFLYILAMIYIFMGIAIASDVFMCAIEIITSRKRTVVKWDDEKGERITKEVLVWNETVANLTLMALGSSAPEILLAVVETVQVLDVEEVGDGLGTFTIIGSAAFNLLIITAICVASVPHPDVKKVRELGVFALTSVWSIFAYVWMLIVVQLISPGEVEPWEAWVTLAYFPIMVLTAYCQDSGWWLRKCCPGSSVEDLQQSQVNVRVVTDKQRRGSVMHGMARELQALEKEKTMRQSHMNLKSLEDLKASDLDRAALENTYKVPEEEEVKQVTTPVVSVMEANVEDYYQMQQARRHSAALLSAASADNSRRESMHSSLSFTSSLNPRPVKIRNSEDPGSAGSQTQLYPTVDGHASPPPPVVLSADARHRHHLQLQNGVVSSNIARARFRHAAVRSMMGGPRRHAAVSSAKKSPQMADVVEVVRCKSVLQITEEDLLGKFTFSAPSYSVLESAGIIEVEVLFHRQPPSKNTVVSMNGNGVHKGDVETSFVSPTNDQAHTGVVSIEYETREGSGKIDKDFKYAHGHLVFKETEYKKTITVPIINDNQYEADVDFYILLRNPTGTAGIGDPSVTRVTIIDDDEPGEFLFEDAHCFADAGTGIVTLNVIRQKGCDGNVTIEFSTIDGTARGGEKLGAGVDYIRSEGMLSFKHGESSKTLSVQVNKEAKGSKNFIITLRNPSLGAKIGDNSAAVANLTGDTLAERIADVLDDSDEEDITWGEQFKNAMVLESQEDEEGREIQLRWYDYVLHFLTFFWKVLFAFIPPRQYWGAWPAFVMSLMMIGGLTALVEELGTLISCVIGLKPSVAGITVIALGTSLPDTFASRTAALHDENADAAIGNITGSNSVNVFLGLGLPWVIKAMYSLTKNRKFKVSTDNLVQSVILFTIVGTICLLLLLVRRKLAGGELGGRSHVVKWGTCAIMVSLWLIYVIVSSLNAYHPESMPW